MDTYRVGELKRKIKELQSQREKAIFEKGLAARENGDLRENFAYDYWSQKELDLTHKIKRLSGILFKKTRRIEKKIKKTDSTNREDLKEDLLKPNRWL